ncbi:hypothetical protein GGI21_004754, partial [Coemansia aciculifera]
MGQPRIRLINKGAPELEDDAPLSPESPSVSKEGGDTTPVTPSRPRRARKSSFGIEEASDGTSGVKEGCLRLFQAVKEMSKDGEPLCLAFNKLPSKKEYPDYYVEIKKPIALDIMKGKITRGVYKAVSDFVADIDLMCSNAQTYNMPESYIYEIAGEIKENVHKLALDLVPADSIAAAAAADSSTTPQLKIRIRQSQLDQGHDEEPSDDEVDGIAQTPSLKRKRGKKRADSESGESDYDRSPMAAAKATATP